MSLNFSIDSILGNQEQSSDQNNSSSSATGARNIASTSSNARIPITSTAESGSLDDEHADASGSGAESVASCSAGSAFSSKTSGSFGFELDQFSSLGDLSQLSKFPYLQRFSRLYVGTPEPNSCASNESQSDPLIASNSRSTSTLTGDSIGSLLPSTSGLQTLSSLMQSTAADDSSKESNANCERLDSNDDLNGSLFQAMGSKDAPLCTKCKLHGIRNEVKGHKKKCPMKDCRCELCILTDYGKRLRGKKAKKVVPSGVSESVIAALNDELRLNEQPEVFQNNVALIVEMLKERLQQDGLEYSQEVSKLKDAVLYLLLKQFDKSKLYSKLVN